MSWHGSQLKECRVLTQTPIHACLLPKRKKEIGEAHTCQSTSRTWIVLQYKHSDRNESMQSSKSKRNHVYAIQLQESKLVITLKDCSIDHWCEWCCDVQLMTNHVEQMIPAFEDLGYLANYHHRSLQLTRSQIHQSDLQQRARINLSKKLSKLENIETNKYMFRKLPEETAGLSVFFRVRYICSHPYHDHLLTLGL